MSGVKGGVEGVSNFAQRASAVASGKEKQEREEREKRKALAAREKKRKNALVTFRGEPYTWVSWLVLVFVFETKKSTTRDENHLRIVSVFVALSLLRFTSRRRRCFLRHSGCQANFSVMGRKGL